MHYNLKNALLMESENKNPNLLLNVYFQGFSQWRFSKGGHSLSLSGVLGH